MLRPTRFFSQNTTIHGFKYTLNAFDFYFWLIPLLLSLSICFYEAQSTISKFLSFKQKITVKTFDAFKDNGQREFPAITFCPKTVFRRSAVGGVGVPLMLTGVNADWGTTNEAIQLDNKDICSGNNRLGDNPGPGVVVMSFDIQGYKKGAGALGRLYLMDSYRTAVQCKYQGRNLNCSNLFYNSWSDSGWLVNWNFKNLFFFWQELLV